MKIYLDGKLVDRAEAKVSVFDHGLLYGDGVFEGIRVYNKLIFRLKEHLDRLYRSAEAIALTIPLSSEEMTRAIIETLKANELRDAYIRLVVTRGKGDLGLDPEKCPKPTIFIITDKIALYPDAEKLYEEGLEIITASTRRNAPEALNPEVKSLNYLNNIMAKIEASGKGVSEALMLTHKGDVVECTGDNIFAVKAGELLTPPCHLGALSGITRGAIIDIAGRLNIKVEEVVMKRDELFGMDEIFLTGTAAEIIPVIRLDGKTIGSGEPGRLTLKLMSEFKKLTETDGVRY